MSTQDIKQSARTIHGIHTELLCQSFADRTLILITQTSKPGCFLQITPPATATVPAGQLANAVGSLGSEFEHLQLPVPDPAISVFSLMGSPPDSRSQELNELYARQVGAIVFSAAQQFDQQAKPIVMGISLRKQDQEVDWKKQRETLAAVLEMVLESRVW